MKHLALITALVAGFLFFTLHYVSPAPFTYDEADYMYAAGRGFVANYLDSPSYSFPAYVRMGLTRGRDPGEKSALSQSVRKTGDLFFYRHAHGPVYFYWLAALSRFTAGERTVRMLSLIFPIVTGCIVYFGCLWILPAPHGPLAAVLATALYLWSPAVIRSTEIAPHQMFTLWFIVTLLLLAKVLTTGERRFWYAAVCATALAFCTLEVTFVLIAAVLACAWLERRRLAADGRFAGKSIALFAAAVVVLHPAALTKLAFAKSYLYFAYLSLLRKAPWGDVTFAGTWSRRFADSPVEWILIAAAVLIWVRRRDLPGWRQALPFLLFGALMLAIMLRVLTTGMRYVLPFVPALYVFAGIVLSALLIRRRALERWAAIAVVLGALLFDAHRYLEKYPFHPDPRATAILAGIHSRNLSSGRLLVPHDDLPTVHYYFPNADITPYSGDSAVPAGHFDAIVGTADPVKIDVESH